MGMAGGTYRDTLRRPGVQAFLWTQFLGAFNDNVCKIIVTFLTFEHFGAKTGAAVVGAVFILPFLLFSGYAGHLADVVSKRTVLIWCKGLEVVAMSAMIPALFASARGVWWPMLAVLALMAVHSTFFSPAKYGLVPEALPPEDLSRANGLLEMTTFVAIVLGSVLGGEVFELWHGEPWWTSTVLIVIAVAGLITSVGHSRDTSGKERPALLVESAERNRTRVFPHRARSQPVHDGHRHLVLLVPRRADPVDGAAVRPGELHVGEAASTRLFTALALGIGAGSLAGRPALGRQGRTGTRADWRVRHGPVQPAPGLRGPVLLDGRAGARARGLCGRLVRGAAERAAATRAGRHREGSRHGDQQRGQHDRHPARVGRALRTRANGPA
jgi:acyl-[acyl-carrier-protein]-phospholipid O-acyltransferase/long-chain-fatty-acid--[acyl-carrier-protein] ligase